MAIGAARPQPGSRARPVQLAPGRHRGARRRTSEAALIVLGDQPRLSVDAVTAAPGLAADGGPTHRRAGLPGRRRPQPGPARASGVRPGRLGQRRPRPRSAARRQPGTRAGGRRDRRQPGRRHAARISSRCWRRPGPRACGPTASRSIGSARSPTAPTSTPRSRASSGPIPAGPTSRRSNPCGRSCGPARRGSTSGPERAATPCRSRPPSPHPAARSSPSTPRTGCSTRCRELADEHGIENVRVVRARWPPDDLAPFRSDVALIAHVGYDIEAIGPFLAAMEAATSRLCVAILMERQPASVADACWPPVHGEARVALPALPEFVELLRALGRDPAVERLERETRRFADRARSSRGSCVASSGSSPAARRTQRFQAALDDQIEVDAHGDGRPAGSTLDAHRHRDLGARWGRARVPVNVAEA